MTVMSGAVRLTRNVALYPLHRAGPDADDGRRLQDAGAGSKLLADALLNVGADRGTADRLARLGRSTCFDPCHAGLYAALDDSPFELSKYAQHAIHGFACRCGRIDS